MKLSFKSVMSTILRGARTLQEMSAAGVSTTNEERKNIGTSDQIKLSKVAMEGCSDTFTFFESDGKIRSYFKAVCDMHIHIQTLSKALIVLICIKNHYQQNVVTRKL